MGRSIRWDIALMHRVAAVEMHAIRHTRAIEVCPWRLGIFARIDVRFHDGTVIVDIITQLACDVVSIFPNNVIAAGRRGKSRSASGDSRFPDHELALVKISLLFPEMDDNLRRARPAVALPVTIPTTLPRENSGAEVLHVGWNFVAAGAENDDRRTA